MTTSLQVSTCPVYATYTTTSLSWIFKQILLAKWDHSEDVCVLRNGTSYGFPYHGFFPRHVTSFRVRFKYSTQHPVLKVSFPLIWDTKFHNHTKPHPKFGSVNITTVLITECYKISMTNLRFHVMSLRTPSEHCLYFCIGGLLNFKISSVQKIRLQLSKLLIRYWLFRRIISFLWLQVLTTVSAGAMLLSVCWASLVSTTFN
jgi:hypothetical protein